MGNGQAAVFLQDQAGSQRSQFGRELQKKIRDRSAKVGVIGLGYVGLPLAMEMAREGYHVTGIDLAKAKVDSINAGVSYIPDVPGKILQQAVFSGKMRATDSLAAAEHLDTINICVPTPLRKNKDPDLSYIVAAAEAVRDHIRPGQLIILESTTYPGTTREVGLPLLEDSGLKAGDDFFLAFSPERVDPGNQHYTTRNIPKVVGGMTPQCTDMAALVYEQFIDHVLPVSSADCAENGKTLNSLALTAELMQSMDCVAILTDHSVLDYGLIANFSSLVFDTRNAMKNFSKTNVVRL